MTSLWWLIVLSTSLLAKSLEDGSVDGPQILASKDEVDESRMPFYKVYVNSQAIRLTWKPDTMKEMAEEEVVLVLLKKSEPHTLKAKTALISDGEVTLDGLAPATLYTMTVTVTQKGKPNWSFSQDIETLSTGSDLLQSEVTVGAGLGAEGDGEGGATSGSGITTAISTLGFTYLAVVLTLMRLVN